MHPCAPGHPESLDHTLVSQEFHDNSKKRIWMFDNQVINNDHLNVEDHKALGTGDHGVVRGTFRYSLAKVTACRLSSTVCPWTATTRSHC